MVQVTVTISGPTASGKSRLGSEIEKALKNIGVAVKWVNFEQEQEARLEAWAKANNAYQPEFPEVILQEINQPVETG